MQRAAALLLAVLAMLLVLVACLAAAWQIGWQSFDIKGDPKTPVQWASPTGDASDLRFRNVQYTVKLNDGREFTRDVSGVLNEMARALRVQVNVPGEPQAPISALRLAPILRTPGLDSPSPGPATASPLTPFSFVLMDAQGKLLNDSIAVPKPTEAPWGTAASRLTGQVRSV